MTKLMPRLIVTTLCVSVSVPAFAQDYVIDWHTVDGGGALFSTGGVYELSGTIGQPDASKLVMSGGDYALNGGFWFDCILGGCDGPVRYVDDDGPMGGYGTSWQSPYRDLQDALAAAALDLDITEIRVAGGVYVPSEQSEPGTPRTETFQLIDGVVLAGNYRGCPGGDCGGGDPDERDLVAYETILSGDLLGDDDTGGSNAENAYHVVTATGTSRATVMDGFTITAGHANAAAPHAHGAGLHKGSLTMIACTFSDNHAGGSGGGVFVFSGVPLLINCRLLDNSALNGGALASSRGGPEFTNCLISGNTSTSHGGAVRVINGSLDAVNCTFEGNISATRGGAIQNHSGATVNVTSSILWGNQAPTGPQIDGAATVMYSCIENGFTGAGNIADDPLFDADQWHLTAASPCVNTGNDAAVPVDVITDLDGDPRVQHCRVDMGVDETDSIGFDCNTNGVADACDLEDETSLDCNGNLVPDECDVMTGGDFDADGDVDLDDYTALVDCLAGPDEAPSPPATECADACLAAFDADADNDVDLTDFVEFQEVFTGSVP